MWRFLIAALLLRIFWLRHTGRIQVSQICRQFGFLVICRCWYLCDKVLLPANKNSIRYAQYCTKNTSRRLKIERAGDCVNNFCLWGRPIKYAYRKV